MVQVLEEACAASSYEVKAAGKVHLYDLSLSLEEINRRLITQGVPVGALYSQKALLEDVYIDELEGQVTRTQK